MRKLHACIICVLFLMSCASAPEPSAPAAEVSSSRDIVSGPSQGRGGIADPVLGRSAAAGALARQKKDVP